MTVTRTPGPIDRAVELLRRLVDEGDSFSRLNVINEIAGTGHIAEGDRRVWAEAWEILRRAGLVCPEAENPKSGDWWFLTGAGRHAVDHDPEGTIRLLLPAG